MLKQPYFMKNSKIYLVNGERFLTAVQNTLTRIVEFPQLFHEVEPNIRHARVPRFPYAVVYRIAGGVIQIVAVAHLRRAPSYWKQGSTRR